DEFKYALVTGAVTGGGLTVIANAPNPAGMSILRHRFSDNTVNPLKLLISAIPPSLVAAGAFRSLRWGQAGIGLNCHRKPRRTAAASFLNAADAPILYKKTVSVQP